MCVCVLLLVYRWRVIWSSRFLPYLSPCQVKNKKVLSACSGGWICPWGLNWHTTVSIHKRYFCIHRASCWINSRSHIILREINKWHCFALWCTSSQTSLRVQHHKWSIQRVEGSSSAPYLKPDWRNKRFPLHLLPLHLLQNQVRIRGFLFTMTCLHHNPSFFLPRRTSRREAFANTTATTKKTFK